MAYLSDLHSRSSNVGASQTKLGSWEFSQTNPQSLVLPGTNPWLLMFGLIF